MTGSIASRRPTKALTAQFVRSIKTPGKYFDGNGLFLRVQQNGSKQWVQRIVIRGKRCEIGLASPALVTLSEARERALEHRKLARAGGDPLAKRREAEAVLTFEAAARKVHQLYLPTWRNEKHGRDFITSLETYAFPHIGRLKVAEVTSSDVLGVLSPIWTGKAETARRVRQRIGTVMKWAIAQGWRQDNPASDIAHALPKTRRTKSHRKALPYPLVASCILAVRMSRASQSTKLALEFLILTAARSKEIRLARWDEIDLHGAAVVDDAVRASWVLSSERMKAKKEHSVPLSGRAVAVLSEAASLNDGSGLIFPGTREGRPLSDMTLSKLVKELGFDADVHGFRTSFRTWAQEQTDYPHEVAEAALAHSQDRVVAAYARSDVFEKRREMMEEWAQYLAGPTDALNGAV